MKKYLLVGLITFMLTCSGCIPILVGTGVWYAGKKVFTRRPKLTAMQRRALETREIEGTKEDILRATVTVFQDKSLSIQTSDYAGGIIVATSQKPPLHITATVEEFTSNRTKMRIMITDKDCVVEDEKVFMAIFEEIQAEVFRRQNLNK